VKPVPFDDALKSVYTLSGEPTAEGKALLERMAAERAERNKDIATLIDEKGQPTDVGWVQIRMLIADLEALQDGHTDNTGAPCRENLDGHDCCYVCNAAEDMLRVTAKYYEDR
jgi:hypothetical protein